MTMRAAATATPPDSVPLKQKNPQDGSGREGTERGGPTTAMSSSSLVLAKSTPLPAKLHDGRRDGRDARNIWILGEEFGNFGRGDKTLPSSSAFSSAQDEKMEFFGPEEEEEEEAAPTYNSPNNEARQYSERLQNVARIWKTGQNGRHGAGRPFLPFRAIFWSRSEYRDRLKGGP